MRRFPASFCESTPAAGDRCDFQSDRRVFASQAMVNVHERIASTVGVREDQVEEAWLFNWDKSRRGQDLHMDTYHHFQFPVRVATVLVRLRDDPVGVAFPLAKWPAAHALAEDETLIEKLSHEGNELPWRGSGTGRNFKSLGFLDEALAEVCRKAPLRLRQKTQGAEGDALLYYHLLGDSKVNMRSIHASCTTESADTPKIFMAKFVRGGSLLGPYGSLRTPPVPSELRWTGGKSAVVWTQLPCGSTGQTMACRAPGPSESSGHRQDTTTATLCKGWIPVLAGSVSAEYGRREDRNVCSGSLEGTSSPGLFDRPASLAVHQLCPAESQPQREQILRWVFASGHVPGSREEPAETEPNAQQLTGAHWYVQRRPGEDFEVHVVIANTGSRPWPPGTVLSLRDGHTMGGPAGLRLQEVPVGSTLRIALPLRAPEEPGAKAYSIWSLADGERVPFGALLWIDAAVVGNEEDISVVPDDSKRLDLESSPTAGITGAGPAVGPLGAKLHEDAAREEAEEACHEQFWTDPIFQELSSQTASLPSVVAPDRGNPRLCWSLGHRFWFGELSFHHVAPPKTFVFGFCLPRSCSSDRRSEVDAKIAKPFLRRLFASSSGPGLHCFRRGAQITRDGKIMMADAVAVVRPMLAGPRFFFAGGGTVGSCRLLAKGLGGSGYGSHQQASAREHYFVADFEGVVAESLTCGDLLGIQPRLDDRLCSWTAEEARPSVTCGSAGSTLFAPQLVDVQVRSAFPPLDFAGSFVEQDMVRSAALVLLLSGVGIRDLPVHSCVWLGLLAWFFVVTRSKAEAQFLPPSRIKISRLRPGDSVPGSEARHTLIQVGVSVAGIAVAVGFLRPNHAEFSWDLFLPVPTVVLLGSFCLSGLLYLYVRSLEVLVVSTARFGWAACTAAARRRPEN
ncbi:ANKRD52 [Symbiodinium sp. CCMP2592]|nr:ANKRD52 [Symbiodinium sp. CCMP2592]